MYKGILHTHTLVVTLFLLLYVVKTILLVLGKEAALKKVTDSTKWFERIISVLFLGTGIYLYLNSGNITWMVHFKILLVFASIPLAIIGFKKKKPALAILSVLFLIASYGLAEMNKKQILKVEAPKIEPTQSQAEVGKQLYVAYCQVCHGENGDAGLSGAKNLITSTLTPSEKLDLIRLGKGNMPAFAASLPDDQILAIIDYTNTFKAK